MTAETKLDYTLDKGLDLVGTATSDWQLNPENQNSDWGYELAKKNQGGNSGIEGSSDPALLPRFDRHYQEILPLSNELGNNALRLSFDFAELCPSAGVFNEEKMAHYVRILAKCHALGIEPLVTLNHWNLPKNYATYDKNDRIKRGPLEHPEIVDHFAFYVDKVADFLCDPRKIRKAVKNEGYDQSFLAQLCEERLICHWFISLNEPVHMLTTPYLLGTFPPYQKMSFRKFPKLRTKIKKMHEISYDTFHETAELNRSNLNQSDVKVGMVHNVMVDTGLPPYEYYGNWGLVDKMEEGADSDFMGIQYYFRLKIGLNGIRGSDPRYHSDHDQFGQVYPAGLYEVLKFAAGKYPHKPLIVSEFGFADKTDLKRPDWILESVAYLIKAKREGVNVSGALLWSLINNFEWCKGMDTLFGLYDIDGQRLASDNGQDGHISSREVWTSASRHLLHPTEAGAAELADLRLKTKYQLDQAVGSVAAK
jgi:beta-glucosidase